MSGPNSLEVAGNNVGAPECIRTKRNSSVLILIKKRQWFLLFALILLLLRLAFFNFTPVAMWESADDYQAMSLAHAIYLDERFSTNAPRHVGYAQVTHPGIPFQFASWAAYRISGFHHSSDFKNRVAETMTDPSRFWLVNQFLPVVIGLSIFALAWGTVSTNSRSWYAIAMPMLYLSYPPVWVYGFMYLGNDTFGLPLGIGLFSTCGLAIQSTGRKAIMWWVLAGLIGGLAYLSKLNYLMWSVGVLVGYCLSALLLSVRGTRVIINVVAYSAGFCIALLGIGAGYLGWAGFRLMIASHLSYLTHDGLYGTGNEAAVGTWKMLSAAQSSVSTYPLFWLLCLVVILDVFLCIWDKRKDIAWLRQQLPTISSTLFAALLVTAAAFKHYSPHYLIPLVVIILYWSWWVACQVTRKYQKPMVVLCAALAFISSFRTNVGEQIQASDNARVVNEEVAYVKALPLASGETRLWSYRITTAEYISHFVVALAEVPYLSAWLKESSPRDLNYNIFNDPEGQAKMLETTLWKYAVFDTKYFGKSSDQKLPDYFSTHGKVIARLENLIVVERYALAFGGRPR